MLVDLETVVERVSQNAAARSHKRQAGKFDLQNDPSSASEHTETRQPTPLRVGQFAKGAGLSAWKLFSGILIKVLDRPERQTDMVCLSSVWSGKLIAKHALTCKRWLRNSESGVRHRHQVP